MNISVGAELPRFRIESVSPEAMKVWAVALHDPNPIHLDPAVVKTKGLGDRVINQGPANLAYIINMLKGAWPNGVITELEVRYVDNVYGGDAVEAGGSITAIVDKRISCDVWLRAEGRDLVIKGAAIVELAS